jgi:hypothetical protein
VAPPRAGRSVLLDLVDRRARLLPDRGVQAARVPAAGASRRGVGRRMVRRSRRPLRCDAAALGSAPLPALGGASGDRLHHGRTGRGDRGSGGGTGCDPRCLARAT